MEIGYTEIVYGIAALIGLSMLGTTYFTVKHHFNEVDQAKKHRDNVGSQLESSLSEIPLWERPGKGPYGSKKYR